MGPRVSQIGFFVLILDHRCLRCRITNSAWIRPIYVSSEFAALGVQTGRYACTAHFYSFNCSVNLPAVTQDHQSSFIVVASDGLRTSTHISVRAYTVCPRRPVTCRARPDKNFVAIGRRRSCTHYT